MNGKINNMKKEEEILSKITGYSVQELHERLTEPILQPYDCLMAMIEFAENQANGAEQSASICKLQNVSGSLFHQIEILANIYHERESKAFEVADHLKAYENNIKSSVVEDIIRMIKDNDC